MRLGSHCKSLIQPRDCRSLGNVIPHQPAGPSLVESLSTAEHYRQSRYNYQIPIVSNTHQDALQSRFNKTLNPKNQIYGDFAFQSTRTGSPNLFGFLDTTRCAGNQ